MTVLQEHPVTPEWRAQTLVRMAELGLSVGALARELGTSGAAISHVLNKARGSSFVPRIDAFLATAAPREAVRRPPEEIRAADGALRRVQRAALALLGPLRLVDADRVAKRSLALAHRQGEIDESAGVVAEDEDAVVVVTAKVDVADLHAIAGRPRAEFPVLVTDPPVAGRHLAFDPIEIRCLHSIPPQNMRVCAPSGCTASGMALRLMCNATRLLAVVVPVR